MSFWRAIAATILTNPAPHVMKTYNLAAPPLTAKSLAATFSKVSVQCLHHCLTIRY
jgi:hypothetical protein